MSGLLNQPELMPLRDMSAFSTMTISQVAMPVFLSGYASRPRGVWQLWAGDNYNSLERRPFVTTEI